MKKKRQHFFSGAPWEDAAGYARILRAGPFIYVSGTTSIDKSGRIVGIGDAGKQTLHILDIIKSALEEAGGSLDAVVRTRIFVTNILDAEKISQAHASFFKRIRPACTLIAVKELVLPELLVEIECDALLDL